MVSWDVCLSVGWYIDLMSGGSDEFEISHQMICKYLY